jgi:hypothetical protein
VHFVKDLHSILQGKNRTFIGLKALFWRFLVSLAKMQSFLKNKKIYKVILFKH